MDLTPDLSLNTRDSSVKESEYLRNGTPSPPPGSGGPESLHDEDKLFFLKGNPFKLYSW